MRTLDPIEASQAPAEVSMLIAEIVGNSFEEPLRECIPVAQQAMRDNFTGSATPSNEDWPARKIPGDGHPLLIDTGALLQAATGGGAGNLTWINNQELAVGVDGGTIPYAATHQYGRGNIPAREFAGLHETAEDECENIIADYMTTTFFGG
jgi:phage gpG-like protein